MSQASNRPNALSRKLRLFRLQISGALNAVLHYNHMSSGLDVWKWSVLLRIVDHESETYHNCATIGPSMREGSALGPQILLITGVHIAFVGRFAFAP
jgi:hypothetical protein